MSCPPFRPHPCFRGAHLQTVLGSLLPSRTPELPWERVELTLPDGDRLQVRHLPGDPARVVHLFHGLGGSAEAGYIRRLAARMHGRGWTVFAPNHRGAGEGRGLAAGPYHSGATGDLSAVLALGRKRYPRARHLAVGYSISGNILLLLLGRPLPGEVLPDGAVAVNPPVDLEACSHHLLRGFSRVYDRRFVRLLVAEIQARVAAGRIPAVDFSGVRTLRDFDAAYTAPAAGYRDREHYYAACSCGPHLQGIQRPVVLLTAEDDPIAPAADLRRFPRAPALQLQVEARGGHMGYVAGRSTSHPDGRWLEVALEHHLEALLQTMN